MVCLGYGMAYRYLLYHNLAGWKGRAMLALSRARGQAGRWVDANGARNAGGWRGPLTITDMPDTEHLIHNSRVAIIGPRVTSGAYILHIAVSQQCDVTFGAFRQGEPVTVPAGDYAYVGSAMGSRGSTSLASRLLRHATRSGERPPHRIRVQMQRRFLQEGLLRVGHALPAQKRLHWHVDYLLDEMVAALRDVFVFRSSVKLEATLAQSLLDEPQSYFLAEGLGAGDAAAPAHLLGVRAGPPWWLTLPQRLQEALEAGGFLQE